MASAFPSAAPKLDVPQCSKAEVPMALGQLESTTFPPTNGECVPLKDGKHLAHVSDFFVNKGKFFTLKEPAGAKLKIAELDDTIYSDEDEVVNGWGKFYLPNIVNMQVVGVVEGTSCPCDELVLMTCEDKQVYAYDGEDLHLVASDLNEISEKGIEYPASKSYYRGEAFEDMTKEDWAEVREGTVGKSLDKEHRKLVESAKARFLENLRKDVYPPIKASSSKCAA